MRRENFRFPQFSGRLRPLLIGGAPYVAAVAAGAMLILIQTARHKPPALAGSTTARAHPESTLAGAVSEPSAASGPAAMPASAPVLVPSVGTIAGAAVTTQVTVGRNDTMDGIFRRMAFDMTDLAAIRRLPGIHQSLGSLRAGDAIEFTHTNGAIERITRKVSETQTLSVVREPTGFVAKTIDNPVEIRVRTATARIDSSLFQAAAAAAISDTAALKLANVFGWDIDFAFGIRKGDHFTAEYEQIYQNGRYLRDGEILAAEFVNNGKTYRAVRFTGGSGTAGYYTPDGKPMRKAFLRTPVDFIRVSSAFNPSRLHPILNLIRGHMGTDYAAPTGTPVHAAGDGRVSFEGRRGGFGNAVMLSHSNNVATLYGHLARFARNVRVGSHVQQGEVIGYVGMTGLATGPHLHYEYLMNGVPKDPQTVQLPGAEPLREDALARFHAAAAPLLSSLSLASVAAPAAVTGTVVSGTVATNGAALGATSGN